MFAAIFFFLCNLSHFSYAQKNFDSFFKDLKSNVSKSEFKKTADLFSYPLTIEINLVKTTYQNQKDFIRSFDSIFTPKVKKSLANQNINDIRIKNNFRIVGNGKIWISKNKKGSFTIRRIFK